MSWGSCSGIRFDPCCARDRCCLLAQPMTVNVFLLPIVGGVAYAAMKPGQVRRATDHLSGVFISSRRCHSLGGGDRG